MFSLQDLFEIMLDFQRMEKLEFGGLKGKLYSEHAAQMYREYSNHCRAFKHSENNPLDLNSQVKLFFIHISIVHQHFCEQLLHRFIMHNFTLVSIVIVIIVAC